MWRNWTALIVFTVLVLSAATSGIPADAQDCTQLCSVGFPRR
jgi:hypothetical protein